MELVAGGISSRWLGLAQGGIGTKQLGLALDD